MGDKLIVKGIADFTFKDAATSEWVNWWWHSNVNLHLTLRGVKLSLTRGEPDTTLADAIAARIAQPKAVQAAGVKNAVEDVPNQPKQIEHGQDPFADKVNAEQALAKAKLQAKEDAAAKLKEANSITIPADMLEKMENRRWNGTTRTEFMLIPNATGRLVKIYYYADRGRLFVSSIIVRTAPQPAGPKRKKQPPPKPIPSTDVELPCWANNVSAVDNARYVQLAVEKLYHGNLKLSWAPEAK